MEPTHIVILGLVVAFCGVAWQTYRGRSNAATHAATQPMQQAVQKPPLILNEENRRFREELRRFILSDIAILAEMSLGFFNNTLTDFQNASQNSRDISAIQRERDDALWFLYAGVRSNYDLKIKPMLDAANKPVEQLDLDDIAKKLKIYSNSYGDDTINFVRFVTISQAKLNADAQERWKAADERVSISFRNLKTFPEAAPLTEQWQSTGVVPSGVYDSFRQRMRILDEAKNAK